MSEQPSVLQQLEVAMRTIEESKRMLFCHPDRVESIKAWLAYQPFGGLVTVVGAPVEKDIVWLANPSVMSIEQESIRVWP